MQLRLNPILLAEGSCPNSKPWTFPELKAVSGSTWGTELLKIAKFLPTNEIFRSLIDSFEIGDFMLKDYKAHPHIPAPLSN